jgi:hypothetical protein
MRRSRGHQRAAFVAAGAQISMAIDIDVAATRRALEAVLAREDEPPPPMRQVAKHLGHATPT